jgi:DNA-binding NarL/FixJ family response regulator
MPDTLRVVIADDNYLVREGPGGCWRTRARSRCWLRSARLTARELEVLREMAQGHCNARIGARLSLSESSVEKYVNSIFAKLGLSEQQVHRRVVAVLTYLRDGS